MLFAETADGQFPINAINSLSKICAEAERTLDHRLLYSDTRQHSKNPLSVAETVASSAVNTVLGLPVELIVVLSETGRMTRLLAKYRPPVAILALCPTSKQGNFTIKGSSTVKYLQTSRGVIGHALTKEELQEVDTIKTVNKIVKDRLCKSGDKVLFIQVKNEETKQESSQIKIIEIE